MTVLELSFPAGRYHATPWGRHVNEGAVEWPPSPWRILRALLATWHLKAREIPEANVRSLVEKLSVPPRFCLPRATASHTRHYMPYNEGKNEKSTKVFDTFLQLEEHSSILVLWDVELSGDERATLSAVAGRLGYFGRAESLVVGRVLQGVSAVESNATPLRDGEPLPPNTELVRLLASLSPSAYDTWREEVEAAANAAHGSKAAAPKRKKTPTPTLPDDLFAALHADTGALQTAGWNLPPGAQFVNYSRPEDAFAPAPRPRAPRVGPPPTVARFAVASAVPPHATQTVSVADRVHGALCKWSDQGAGRAAVFTGLDGEGKPLEGHGHAHIFCEANNPLGVVTHITIWAEMGFDEAARLALRRLNRVWGHAGHDIRLVLHSIGQPDNFKDCALFEEAKVWRSATPYVSTRHAKTYRDGRPKMDENGWQEGSAAHDLLRLLALNPKWRGAKIRKQLAERESPFVFGGKGFRSLQFQTIRRNRSGKRGQDGGGAFIIEFPEPVRGPIALGYGAHFGLGLFRPVPVPDGLHGGAGRGRAEGDGLGRDLPMED